MTDIIINGYIFMWVLVLMTSWTPAVFIGLGLYEGDYTGRLYKAKRKFRLWLTLAIVMVLSSPFQLALMQEWWRG